MLSLSMLARLFVLIIVLAGGAGWVYAFYATQDRDALERRATQAELYLSAKWKENKEFATLLESYRRGEKAAERDAVMKQLQTSRKELVSVIAKIAPAKNELRELTTKINAAGVEAANLEVVMKQLQTSRKELVSVAAKIAPAKNELRELTTKINAAGVELEKLTVSGKQIEALISGARQKYRTTTRARVRAGPGTNFDEVAILPSGITLPSFETAEGGNWQKVGCIGYVHNDLLEPISDE